MIDRGGKQIECCVGVLRVEFFFSRMLCAFPGWTDMVSPLAPKVFPTLPAVDGVRMAVTSAGIRYKNRIDTLLVECTPGTQVAGALTRSSCRGAPVDWCRSLLHGGEARGLLVNSGNANAFTGKLGAAAAAHSAALAALALGCRSDQVFLASTGVIGEPLDASKFEGILDQCARRLTEDVWLEAAQAMMTTDTFAKIATTTAKIGGHHVTINGIAKGSGMIAPDMATTLAFVFTDAPVSASALQAMVTAALDTTFNAITVDGDTSTSDTLLVFATGAARARGVPGIDDSEDPIAAGFGKALHSVLFDLAQQVVRDGEGATKLIEVNVTGATSSEAAKRIAQAVGNSPLVKTAIAGEDANWGRVVMAVGKAGQPADRDRLSVWFGPHLVAFDGQRASDYDDEKVTEYMQGEHVKIRIDLGLGSHETSIWTCDLTSDYLRINGSYRS